MANTLFVSVHIPKTAGTSFRYALENIFGDNLLLDYRSKPLDKGYSRRAMENGAEDLAAWQAIEDKLAHADVCVHGHFLPAKYLAIFPNAKLITWMRDPAQRLMSHYQYWLQNPQPDHFIASQVIAQAMDFEDFCRIPQLRNVMDFFLGGTARDRFDFIGLSESYETCLAQLCQQFAWKGAIEHNQLPAERLNPEKKGESYDITAATATLVQSLNDKDYAHYEHARSLWP